MYNRLIFLLAVFCVLKLNAQDYPATLISDSLSKDANAVLRSEEFKITIKDIDRASISHKYVVTVLNEAGRRYAVYHNTYDKLVSLSDIDGNLYDAAGKHLKNVKKKDIADFIDDDEMTLATDSRIKMHNFYYTDYPYTVEYEDEQDFDGIFYLPYWIPQLSNHCAVQQSRFVVETPVNYQLHYKAFKYTGNPVIVNDGKKITYTWEVKNLKAFDDEDFSPSWEETTTAVFLSPVDFKIEGYTGKMDTWQNLGKFIAQLNAGRDVLPDNVKKDVHSLTDNLKTTREKAFALYNYLQKNTRYILVKLGIGGWQPYDANYVATKKYGDCKALSNYMVSLLKEAGIKGNYVLVNGDDEDTHGLWEDFPSPFFNHAIVCVPDGKDTLWFECTNQTMAPGYMSGFTGNRKALMISDDGGHVVNTPVYTPEDNMQVRAVSASIDSTGKLNALLNTTYTGIQQDMPHAIINDLDKDFKDKFLNKELNLPTYQVNTSKYIEKKNLIPEVDEQLDITALSYAIISGKRLFVKPNLFNKVPTKYNENDKRLFDIDYPYSFHDIDSIEIIIPKGYFPESMPKDLSLNSKFGSYKISYTADGDKLKVERDYTRFAGRFPASDFSDFAKFYDDIYKADRSQVVLIKKDTD
jgi:transglutaminase-like putative cysteine protease